MNQNKNHYHFADNSNRPLKSNKRPDRRDLLRKRRTPGSNKQPGGKPGGKSKMSLGHIAKVTINNQLEYVCLVEVNLGKNSFLLPLN